MNEETVRARLTVDELSLDSDGNSIATLIDTRGRTLTVPIELLPTGAKVNDVIAADFRIDRESTVKRKARVSRLQHRLFTRGSERE